MRDTSDGEARTEEGVIEQGDGMACKAPMQHGRN